MIQIKDNSNEYYLSEDKLKNNIYLWQIKKDENIFFFVNCGKVK